MMNVMPRGLFVVLLTLISIHCIGQIHYISKVWVADNGDGTYKNPVLNADYSDPDVIRTGDDYYLVSSSFSDMPGLPILQSNDLVNWRIIGHALQKLEPEEEFSKPQHGNGVWAPSIRYHDDEFYIYYPDPDHGIYLVKAKKATGPWSEPILVEAGKGLEDPCPLWDDDGQVYLVHAFAGSRAGIKSILFLKKMNAEGTKVIDKGVMIYDGHVTDPTIEGPKIYKRNGYYYILAPAGGVTTGWQVALRSKNIYGPYERKVVMDQGTTAINGPHQGAWVTTQTGEDRFLHFRDNGAYGRVVYLEPMKWVGDWPVIGIDKNGDGKGEPVTTYKKPDVGKTYPIETPEESDEFEGVSFGKQWQWMANPKAEWSTMAALGSLRLYAIPMPDSVPNLWFVPNILLQKFPSEDLMATTKLRFNGTLKGEKVGLTIMGMDYASISIVHEKDNNIVTYTQCKDANKGSHEEATLLDRAADTLVYLRVTVRTGGQCRFSYSFDGKHFTDARHEFTARQRRWVGAKVGLFCTGPAGSNKHGCADVEWFRVEPVE